MTSLSDLASWAYGEEVFKGLPSALRQAVATGGQVGTHGLPDAHGAYASSKMASHVAGREAARAGAKPGDVRMVTNRKQRMSPEVNRSLPQPLQNKLNSGLSQSRSRREALSQATSSRGRLEARGQLRGPDPRLSTFRIPQGQKLKPYPGGGRYLYGPGS